MCERGFENLFMLSGGEQSCSLPHTSALCTQQPFRSTLSVLSVGLRERVMLSGRKQACEMSSSSVSMSVYVGFVGRGEWGFHFCTVGFVDLRL